MSSDARKRAEKALLYNRTHANSPRVRAALVEALEALLAAEPAPPASAGVPLPVCMNCSFASGGHVHVNREDGAQAVRYPTAEEWNAAMRAKPDGAEVREAAEVLAEWDPEEVRRASPSVRRLVRALSALAVKPSAHPAGDVVREAAERCREARRRLDTWDANAPDGPARIALCIAALDRLLAALDAAKGEK